jgi:hypothetical protein
VRLPRVASRGYCGSPPARAGAEGAATRGAAPSWYERTGSVQPLVYRLYGRVQRRVATLARAHG